MRLLFPRYKFIHLRSFSFSFVTNPKEKYDSCHPRNTTHPSSILVDRKKKKKRKRDEKGERVEEGERRRVKLYYITRRRGSIRKRRNVCKSLLKPSLASKTERIYRRYRGERENLRKGTDGRLQGRKEGDDRRYRPSPPRLFLIFLELPSSLLKTIRFPGKTTGNVFWQFLLYTERVLHRRRSMIL